MLCLRMRIEKVSSAPLGADLIEKSRIFLIVLFMDADGLRLFLRFEVVEVTKSWVKSRDLLRLLSFLELVLRYLCKDFVPLLAPACFLLRL